MPTPKRVNEQVCPHLQPLPLDEEEDDDAAPKRRRTDRRDSESDEDALVVLKVLKSSAPAIKSCTADEPSLLDDNSRERFVLPFPLLPFLLLLLEALPLLLLLALDEEVEETASGAGLVVKSLLFALGKKGMSGAAISR